MGSWNKSLVFGALASLLFACGGMQASRQTTVQSSSASQGPRVEIDGSSLVLFEGGSHTPIAIHFAVDSDVIEPSLHGTLNVLAEFLKAHDARQHVEVRGHADERGSDAYNKKLSLRRAKAVMQYLVDRGVDPLKLSVKGLGEEFAHAAAGASHHENRRVEFALEVEPTRLSDASSAMP